MVLYLLNGIAFLLLGLQLKAVLLAMPRESWQSLASYALALYAIVTVVRLAWVYPGTWLPRVLFRHIARREHAPDPRAVFLVGWAGIRGSVTLAAALSIPLLVAGGAVFPGRDLIIFLAGTTIVATLCINGLTLPLMLRLLDLPQDGAAEREERLARQAMASAAADAMRSAVDTATTSDDAARAQRLLRTFERQMQRHSADEAQRKELESVDAAELELRRRALSVERARLHGLRDTGVINDTTLRTIEAGIDHAESLLAGDSGMAR
jgi:CPA1 family monovalent cation:H+ antiporter